MASLGSFPIDIVLLAMIAAFLVLRLRSVLGKRTGVEPAPATRFAPATAHRTIDVKAETPSNAPAKRALPPRESEVGQSLTRIMAADPAFNLPRFLDGADAAFRFIVGAFAEGNRDALRPLLTPAMFDLFDQAIANREANGWRQHTMVHAIRSSTIEAADLTGTTAQITLKFVTDQVSYTQDAAGQFIAGTEAVTEIVDLWTFEHEVNTRDLTWRLAASRAG